MIAGEAKNARAPVDLRRLVRRATFTLSAVDRLQQNDYLLADAILRTLISELFDQ